MKDWKDWCGAVVLSETFLEAIEKAPHVFTDRQTA